MNTFTGAVRQWVFPVPPAGFVGLQQRSPAAYHWCAAALADLCPDDGFALPEAHDRAETDFGGSFLCLAEPHLSACLDRLFASRRLDVRVSFLGVGGQLMALHPRRGGVHPDLG